MKHTEDTRRVCLLDLLRFLAAASVMLYHYSACVGYFSGNTSFFSIFRYGYLGVDVFFTISGFVIAMSAEGRTWRQFLVSRFCRLYPAFWFCCTMTFVVTTIIFRNHTAAVLHRSAWEYLVNLTMLPKLVRAQFVDEVYWTLQIETVFYFLIFCLLLFSTFGKIKTMLYLWALVSLIDVFVESKFLKVALITDYSAYFILGVLYYLATKEKWDWGKIVLACAMLALAMYHVVRKANGMQFACPAGPAVAVVILLNAIFLAISVNRLRIKSDWLTRLGEVTYPLYLLHNVLGVSLIRALPLPNATRVVLSAAILLGASFATARLVERPFSRWLKPHITSLVGLAPADGRDRVIRLLKAQWSR